MRRGHGGVVWGFGGSALPNALPSRPKPWWNHKKLDCLPFALGATRMRPSLPRFLQIPAATLILPPSRCSPFTSHYTDAALNPQLLHVMGSFPLRCRNTKCSIKRPIALYQQSPGNGQCITLMGGSNMLRSCVVMLNFCCTNLSFLPQRFCEERWMKGRFGNGDWGEQRVHHKKDINMC